MTHSSASPSPKEARFTNGQQVMVNAVGEFRQELPAGTIGRIIHVQPFASIHGNFEYKVMFDEEAWFWDYFNEDELEAVNGVLVQNPPSTVVPSEAPTSSDILDMFAEMPRKVQVAVLSHVHAMRSKGFVYFWEYDMPVAEYIQASGLLNVEFRVMGGVRFRGNEQTQVIRENLRACLEMTGIQF